ncbi:MAG: LysR family transcriptional regulator [Caulobacterales bacterium]|nr:LysR family transcriptional regulator [Caulobacterales bacterium]
MTVAASNRKATCARMLELKHLRAFATIANCGTIAKAARRLAIAESPLGRQLKALERDLGQGLFDRRGRRLHLTAAGAALLPRAQALLGLAEDLRRPSDTALASDPGGTVRLGLVPGVAWHPALGRVVLTVRQRHPAITLELAVDATQFLTSGLRSGTHDLVLLRRPLARGGTQSRLLCREALCLVSARSLGPLTPRRLAVVPWLEPAGRPLAALQGALEEAGLGQRQRLVVPDLATAAAMARSGIGVLLTHASVAEALSGVHTTPPPFPLPAQEIHLGWRTGGTTGAVETLRTLFRQAFTVPIQ